MTKNIIFWIVTIINLLLLLFKLSSINFIFGTYGTILIYTFFMGAFLQYRIDSYVKKNYPKLFQTHRDEMPFGKYDRNRHNYSNDEIASTNDVHLASLQERLLANSKLIIPSFIFIPLFTLALVIYGNL